MPWCWPSPSGATAGNGKVRVSRETDEWLNCQVGEDSTIYPLMMLADAQSPCGDHVTAKLARSQGQPVTCLRQLMSSLARADLLPL